jgi:hypothetical protein
MIKSVYLVIASSIILIGWSSSCSATIVDVTYTGTITTSTDAAGVFGGGSYVGLTYIAQFSFDPSLGIPISYPGGSGSYGGNSSMPQQESPVLSASVTLNGRMVALPNTSFTGEDALVINEPIASNNYGTLAISTSLINSSALIEGPDVPSSIYQSGTFIPPATDQTYFQYNLLNSDSLYIFGDVTSYTVEVPSMPEPSTWAMMLLGFCGIGFMAYRGSRKRTDHPTPSVRSAI